MKPIFWILSISMALLSCERKRIKTNPVKESITESVYASGIVKSRDEYQVYSPVNGLIQKILVAEGDIVKKETPLLQIISEAARLNIQNAQLASDNAGIVANRYKLNEIEATIRFLKNKVENDSLLLERQRLLWTKAIGSRNELEQRQLAYENDLASYYSALSRYYDLKKQLNFAEAQSKNNLQISKTLANDFTVKSQIAGRVYTITKKKGEMVTTQTPIAVIGGATAFLLELQVDEYDIGKIQPGQKVLLTMDSYRKQLFEGSITRIIPFMNNRTRSFTVEASFTSSPPSLYPNLTVEANIIIQTKENAITIPRDYLVNDLLVLLGTGKEKKVITGLKDYQKVEIISGLTNTDIIMKPAP
jgi:HlyD family secretion protein